MRQLAAALLLRLARGPHAARSRRLGPVPRLPGCRTASNPHLRRALDMPTLAAARPVRIVRIQLPAAISNYLTRPAKLLGLRQITAWGGTIGAVIGLLLSSLLKAL